MLQQTQVVRVLGKYPEFLRAFPTIEVLAEASLIDAFNLDQTPLSANAYDYMAYRARWLGAESSNDKTKSSKE